MRCLHCLDRVAQKIEQDLLNLHLVDEHKIHGRVELEAHAHSLIFGSHERERARFLDQSVDTFHAPLAFAARNEVAQAANDLARA